MALRDPGGQGYRMVCAQPMPVMLTSPFRPRQNLTTLRPSGQGTLVLSGSPEDRPGLRHTHLPPLLLGMHSSLPF